MVSAIMQETAKYGVGKVTGKSKHTKEDLKDVDDIERDFLKGTKWVRVE